MMLYKIYGWFCVVLGTLAFFAGVTENEVASLAGGLMFLAAGACILNLINTVEKK